MKVSGWEWVRSSKPTLRYWVRTFSKCSGLPRQGMSFECCRQSQSTIQKSKNPDHFSHLAPRGWGVGIVGGLYRQEMGRSRGRAGGCREPGPRRPHWREPAAPAPLWELAAPAAGPRVQASVRPARPGPGPCRVDTSSVTSPSSPALLMRRPLFPLWFLSLLLGPRDLTPHNWPEKQDRVQGWHT